MKYLLLIAILFASLLISAQIEGRFQGGIGPKFENSNTYFAYNGNLCVSFKKMLNVGIGFDNRIPTVKSNYIDSIPAKYIFPFMGRIGAIYAEYIIMPKKKVSIGIENLLGIGDIGYKQTGDNVPTFPDEEKTHIVTVPGINIYFLKNKEDLYGFKVGMRYFKVTDAETTLAEKFNGVVLSAGFYSRLFSLGMSRPTWKR